MLPLPADCPPAASDPPAAPPPDPPLPAVPEPNDPPAENVPPFPLEPPEPPVAPDPPVPGALVLAPSGKSGPGFKPQDTHATLPSIALKTSLRKEPDLRRQT